MTTSLQAVAEPQLHPAADVRRLSRIGLIMLLSAFGAGGTWAALAPLAGAIIAQGVVKVDNNRKTVQHLEGGIVKEILVRDGDRVRAGQPLIVLGDKRVSAALDLLSGQVDAETAKAARLQAERDELTQVVFPESLGNRAADAKVAEIVRVETIFFETKRRALTDQITLIKQQTKEIQQEIASLNTQVKAEESAAGLLGQEIRANEALLKQQFISQVRLLTLKRGFEEYQARRGEHQAAIAKARQKITELELRGVALRNQYVRDAANELTAVSARLSDLEERLQPSRDAVGRQTIVAPIAGKLVDMKVFTIGGVVGPGEPLLDIVPDDNPLIVEARLDVDDIDDVRPGLPVDIRLSAYHARNTPLVSGSVTHVSADRLTDKVSGAPYYLAHVRVEPSSLASAVNLRLYPGMPAEIFIKTGDRTALDYLLEPVTGSLRRALREP